MRRREEKGKINLKLKQKEERDREKGKRETEELTHRQRNSIKCELLKSTKTRYNVEHGI